MKKFCILLFNAIFFWAFWAAAQVHAVDDLDTLPQFINRAFSRMYIPNPANKFDPVMTTPDYLGLEIQNTYSYEFVINFGPRPIERPIDLLINGTIQTIFNTQAGSRINQALLKSGIKKINFRIHIVRSDNSILDSWTDKNFNIHIFLSSQLLTQEHLIKIITHEFGQMLSNINVGRLKNAINETYSDIEVLKPLLFELLNSQKFLVTLATMRAFALESKVILELSAESKKASSSTLSCVNFLNRVALMLEYSGYIDPNVRDENFEKFLSIFAANNKNKKFCETLISIELSDAPKSKSGWGPRPNIGAGDG